MGLLITLLINELEGNYSTIKVWSLFNLLAQFNLLKMLVLMVYNEKIKKGLKQSKQDYQIKTQRLLKQTRIGWDLNWLIGPVLVSPVFGGWHLDVRMPQYGAETLGEICPVILVCICTIHILNKWDESLCLTDLVQ